MKKPQPVSESENQVRNDGRSASNPAEAEINRQRIDMELLEQDAELYPDAYQYERAERFGCGRRGTGEALKRLKISRKKTLSHPKTDEKTRCIFQDRIRSFSPSSASKRCTDRVRAEGEILQARLV